jgi:mannose-6-phosphate isomerase-like protein (cupin superfamily)
MPVITAAELDGGTLRGVDHGATISLILDRSGPGEGPRLHRHTYDETWVVVEGEISFLLGDSLESAGPGDVVIAPPGVPHRFTVDGPGRAMLVCIHASPTMQTEWLE